MKCEACKREKELVARGLCRACYSRWHKHGTTEYQRWGRKTPCQVKGCEKAAVSHGFCDTHRKRLERHGNVDATRPDSWGAIEKHPLRNAWQRLRRYRGQFKICPEWENDFLQFVVDIGDRPSPIHKLYVADDSKPIGPGNFVWKRALTERVAGEDLRTYANRRMRAYRAVNKEQFKGYDLKKLFGISREDYVALHTLQKGKCAICANGETSVIRGNSLNLAVDHCHSTGAIRGLLCAKCNTGLGSFRDDPEILQRAIAYLNAGK